MCKPYRYMSVDWCDLLGEIEELSPRAQLSVFTLIAKGWCRGAPLPDDDRKIARLLGMQLRTWRGIRAEIEPLFDLAAGSWEHPQMMRARDHAERRAASENTDKSSNFSRFAAHNPLKNREAPSHNDKNNDVTSREVTSVCATSADKEAPPPRVTTPPGKGERRKTKRAGSGCRPDRPRDHRTNTPKTAIPADWFPTAADFAFALERGFDDGSIRHVARWFFNHHRARDSRRADWAAAWKEWCIVALERRERFRTNADRRAERERRGREATYNAILQVRAERERRARDAAYQ